MEVLERRSAAYHRAAAARARRLLAEATTPWVKEQLADKEPDKSGVGEVCLLRKSGKSQSSASEQQIDDKHDQQNTADTDPATISPPVIPETSAEEEYQYYNN
jgi:hypothetical protein